MLILKQFSHQLIISSIDYDSLHRIYSWRFSAYAKSNEDEEMGSRNYRDRRSSSEHNRLDEKRCHICRTMVLTRNYVRHVNGHQRYPVSRRPYGRPPGCRNQPGYTMAQIRAMESAQSNYPRDVVPDHDLLPSVKRCANRIYPLVVYDASDCLLDQAMRQVAP